MPPSRSIHIAALVALAGFAAVPAVAHEFWLSPSCYSPDAREPVGIGALTGVAFTGERKLHAPGRTVRFLVRAARDLDLRTVAEPGDTTWVRFAPADNGGAMLAYESDFATLTLDGAEFDLYLEEEGLEGPLAVRRERGGSVPGRERYRRCAKAWLAGDDAARATTLLGLPLEIVPLEAPGTDSTLRVRVLFEGRPLAGVQLRAWRQPFGPGGGLLDPARRKAVPAAWLGRTNAQGEALVPTAEAGEWLLGAVHMIASRDTRAADWESTWASLTFARDAMGCRTSGR